MTQTSPTTSPAMNLEMYTLLDTVPDTYWRYVARHELFSQLWATHRVAQETYKVLDIGCGAGGLLAYLGRQAAIDPVGVDLFSGTLPYCQGRGINAVSAADAVALPFRENSFDFVIAQDVVEHIENDANALQEMYRVCTPGGLALILVPAFSFLWSARDVGLRHYRRYTLPLLAQRTQAAGFKLLHQTYTDMFLLPLLYAAVKVASRNSDGLANLDADAAPGGSGIINQAALAVSRLEALAARFVGLPFGVATLVLARKI